MKGDKAMQQFTEEIKCTYWPPKGPMDIDIRPPIMDPPFEPPWKPRIPPLNKEPFETWDPDNPLDPRNKKKPWENDLPLYKKPWDPKEPFNPDNERKPDGIPWPWEEPLIQPPNPLWDPDDPFNPLNEKKPAWVPWPWEPFDPCDHWYKRKPSAYPLDHDWDPTDRNDPRNQPMWLPDPTDPLGRRNWDKPFYDKNNNDLPINNYRIGKSVIVMHNHRHLKKSVVYLRSFFFL